MSTTAQKAREKAARLAAGRTASGSADSIMEAADSATVATPAAAPAVRAERVKPVRVTLDLAPALYGELTDWQTTTAREIKQPRIPTADVLRALVRRLLVDEELQRHVTESLRKG